MSVAELRASGQHVSVGGHARGNWATAEEAALNEARAMRVRLPSAKRVRHQSFADATSDEGEGSDEVEDVGEEQAEDDNGAFDDDGLERGASPLRVVAYSDDEEDQDDGDEEDGDWSHGDGVHEAVAEAWGEGSAEYDAVVEVEAEAVAAEEAGEGVCSVVAVQVV